MRQIFLRTLDGGSERQLTRDRRDHIQPTWSPDGQRLAFLLRKVHDLDYDAVGQGLGCSAETARAHVFQALRKIRQGLDQHELPRTEVPR